MSSTKILIVVLVLIGLLFAIFVARGALRNDPQRPTDKRQLESSAKKTKPPGWTNTIKLGIEQRQLTSWLAQIDW